MKTQIIKPGLLVVLKSTVAGGVSYKRVDLENDANRSRWETTRIVDDPQEHDRATKARSKASAEIRAVCSATAFGLLCPEDREKDLDGAIARARAIVDEHNQSATFTRIAIYALKGRIASTDEEAARAIGEEVRSLVDAMGVGIDKLDPEAIREAATKAKALTAMLDDSQVEKVSEAIKQARSAARAIVKRVEKEGEAAAVVLADIQRGAIEKARMAFLDLDDAPAREESMPHVDVQRFDGIEVQ
jgi:hypothetical protein